MFKSLFDSGKKTNFFLLKKMHSLQSTKNQPKSAITRPFFYQPWNRLIFYAIPQLFSRVVHDLVAWNEVWSRLKITKYQIEIIFLSSVFQRFYWSIQRLWFLNSLCYLIPERRLSWLNFRFLSVKILKA